MNMVSDNGVNYKQRMYTLNEYMCFNDIRNNYYLELFISESKSFYIHCTLGYDQGIYASSCMSIPQRMENFPAETILLHDFPFQKPN